MLKNLSLFYDFDDDIDHQHDDLSEILSEIEERHMEYAEDQCDIRYALHRLPMPFEDFYGKGI